MKNINKLAILAFASALALTSCGKKDAATISELDGDWTLVSGTLKEVQLNYNYSTGKLSSTETTECTYNGTAWKGTWLQEFEAAGVANETDKVENKTSVKISFDKKAGSYDKTDESSDDNTTEGVIYYIVNIQSPGSYIEQAFDVKSTSAIKSVETGNYTTNQASGDIKKGSQISLASTSTITTTKSDYTFYKSGQTTAFPADVFTRTFDYAAQTYTYKTVDKTSESVRTVKTPEYKAADILKVIESTKKSLKVSMNSKYSTVTAVGIVESNKSETNSEIEMDFEQ